MRVQLVDPSAFTPPYDRALAAALSRAGADVELLTSRFLYGPVPPADGYRVEELFYRRSSERGLDAPARRARKLFEHLGDMRRFRRRPVPDLVHYQWLTVPALDAHLLPSTRPRVMTAHYVLPPSPSVRQVGLARSVFGRMDAVIAHSEHGAGRLREEVGLDPERVRVISHGAFDYLTEQAEERPLPDELAGAEGPVFLFFGLLRPYKGIDVLLRAFSRLRGAELWIVGNPRMDVAPLRALADEAAGRVRFLTRFVEDAEIPALFRRADVVVLPYRDAEHSGVLYTALAFGKPLVLSDVGGFSEVAAEGAALLVPPEDEAALAATLEELLADEGAREELAAAASRAAAGPYSWDMIAGQTLDLYRELLEADPVIAVEVLFWLCAALIVYTHAGYPLALLLLTRVRGNARHPRTREQGREHSGDDERALAGAEEMPVVSLIVAAYDEEGVIAEKVANALALDYPRERLEVIVASDGSADATAARAEAAGADLVLDLPRGGKIAAQNAAAERASGEILAFSDANCSWATDALRRLVAPFEEASIGYVCGQVRFSAADGGNVEGAYWRYEMAVRGMESALAGVTAGNGGIYAVRAADYVALPASGSHDLSFPFALAKRRLRSLYAPAARAEEKMVPTVEGEFARKRRMMAGLWDIVVGEGMLRPRGYPALYAFELASHRLLRYLTPFLHLAVLAANLALLGRGWVYSATLAIQTALLAAALLAGALPLAPLRFARYYVLTTASIAAGLWDRARRGAPGAWEKAEGTR